MDLEKLEFLAKKVLHGFSIGKLTNAGMELTNAELLTINRGIKKDNYKGTAAFYIISLCSEAVDSIHGRRNRAQILEKLLHLKSMNSRESKTISEVLDIDIEKLPDVSEIKEDFYNGIFYCAAISSVIQSGLKNK